MRELFGPSGPVDIGGRLIIELLTVKSIGVIFTAKTSFVLKKFNILWVELPSYSGFIVGGLIVGGDKGGILFLFFIFWK